MENINNKNEIILTEDKIQAVFYGATTENVQEFYRVFNKYAYAFRITEEVHVNFFLAQLLEEVGPSLVPVRENLNYSCDALKKIFKYYRSNTKAANADGRCSDHKADQYKIANNVYNGRLGNVKSDDGSKFRGGGYIQITGRSNYEQATSRIVKRTGKKIKVHEVLERIEDVDVALLTAMAFWDLNKIYKCPDIDCVTSKVSKYTKSYAKRKNHYKKIAKL